MRRVKEPTSTSRVLEVLRSKGTFVTVRDMFSVTHLSHNRVSAALCHLRSCGAIDYVDDGGERWWWSLRPESDRRNYVVVERAVECQPRKSRIRRA